MMGVTHRPFGAAWWLGGVLAANTVGAGISPVVAGVGALVAPVFAAGRLSPDADVTWLRRLGHRQATHRPDTTAAVLTGVTAVVWLVFLLAVPGQYRSLHWLVWAPVAAWWSHLVGDALFGRIPVGRRVGGVLVRVLPARLVRRSSGRQAYWVGFGWDTDGPLERGKVYVSRLPRWLRWMVREPARTESGLHTTVRVLPFGPATLLAQAASLVLFVVILAT